MNLTYCNICTQSWAITAKQANILQFYLHHGTRRNRRWQKGNPVPGSIIGPPQVEGFSNLRYEIWSSVNTGTWTREWLHWWEPAVSVNNRPVLSSPTALHINKQQRSDRSKNLVMTTRWGGGGGGGTKTDWPTVQWSQRDSDFGFWAEPVHRESLEIVQWRRVC
jgi:hypothetical protein